MSDNVRKEILEQCAVIAETEFAEHPDWDRPVYSATGCGKWIAACIRALDGPGPALTNVPWRPKRKSERQSRAEARATSPKKTSRDDPDS